MAKSVKKKNVGKNIEIKGRSDGRLGFFVNSQGEYCGGIEKIAGYSANSSENRVLNL